MPNTWPTGANIARADSQHQAECTLKVFTPSSTALSRSSSNCSVDPFNTMLQMDPVLGGCSSTITLLPPMSLHVKLSAYPISSCLGGVSLTCAAAPVALCQDSMNSSIFSGPCLKNLARATCHALHNSCSFFHGNGVERQSSKALAPSHGLRGSASFADVCRQISYGDSQSFRDGGFTYRISAGQIWMGCELPSSCISL